MALPTSVGVSGERVALYGVQDTFTLAAAGDVTCLAAPSSGRSIWVQKVVIGVSVTVDTAVIALEDGVDGDRLWQIKANAGDDAGVSGTTHVIDFGDRGVKLTASGLLNLTIQTANATVHGTAVGYVTG